MSFKKLILLAICFSIVFASSTLVFSAENDVLPTIYGYDNFEMYPVGAKDFKFASPSEKVEQNKIEINEKNGNKYMYYYRNIRDPLVDFVVDVSEDSFIFEADFSFESGKGVAKLFNIINYDKSAGKDRGCDLLKYNASKKTIYAYNGSEEVTILSGVKIPTFSWSSVTYYKISLVIDQVNDTYDVYVNRSLVKSGLKFNYDGTFSTMKKFRMTAEGSTSGNAIFKLDNWIVYGGKSFIDTSKQIRNTIFYTDNEAVDYFSGCTAFSTAGKSALVNGSKISVENPVITSDDELYISEKIVTASSEIASVTQNGTKYFNLSQYCDNNGLNHFVDESGFGIIGKRNLYQPDFTPSGIDEYTEYSRYYLELYNYLTFERPKSSQIKSSYKNSAHPRLICDAAGFEKIRQEIALGGLKKQFYDKLITEAEEHLTLDTPTYSKSDGVRLDVHDCASPIRELALAYQLSGDEKYADKAYEIMAAISNFSDWNPNHFLDIGVILGSIAIGYDWIYDTLDKETEIPVIENGMYNNGLVPSLEVYLGGQYGSWVTSTGNWNAICNSGVVLAASALADVKGDECFTLIEYALRSLEYHMNIFAPDGGYEEGLSYLNYTTRHISYVFGALNTAFTTDFGYYNAPGFANSPYYALCVDGATGGFNFHDASGGTYYSAETAWHAAMQNSADLHSLRYKYIQKGHIDAYFDLIYLDSEKINYNPERPSDMYFSNVQTGSMRSAWDDKTASYVGYHCGKNTAGHMNYDSGTFVFDQMGVRWAIDLGSDDYNLVGYNEEDNNPIYRKRAEGQNVYVINPDKSAGQLTQSNDYVEKRENSENSAFVIMNLTDAYQRDVSEARRGIMLGENRNTMTLRDEIVFKNESEFFWFMHTKAEISISGSTAYLTQNGKKMKFEFISNQPLSIRVDNAVQQDSSLRVEGEDPNTGIRKITIGGTVSGKLDLTVKLSPVIEGGTFEAISDTPLDEWENGESFEYSSKMSISQSSSGKASMTFNIANISSKSSTVQVVAALYSDSKLYDILWQEKITVGRLEYKNKAVQYNMKNIKKPEIKIFVFDGINTLVPKAYCKGVIL